MVVRLSKALIVTGLGDPHFLYRITDVGEVASFTALYPPRSFLVIISVRSRVGPRDILRLEGLGQVKHPLTS
jgi:hypothetical protein